MIKLNVEVHVDTRVRQLPANISKRDPELCKAVALRLRDRMVHYLGGRGRMGATFKVRTSGRTAWIESGHPGSLAQDVGAFIVPKRRKVLRFERADKMVYTRGPVRIKAKRFSAKALREKNAIINDVAPRIYADLL